MTQDRKNNKNTPKPTPAERLNYLYDYPDMGSASSMTESTGLMQRPTEFDEEFASYQELCGLQVPKIDPAGAKQRDGKEKNKNTCNKCGD